MTNRRRWFDLEERGVLWGMRLILWIRRVLGRRLCLGLVRIVVFYYWLANGRARRASQDYRNRLAAYASPPRVAAGAVGGLRHFNEFAVAMIDKLSAWQGGITAADVDTVNAEVLRSVLDSGRGALLIGAHLGNLEVSRAISELRPAVRLNVLVHTRHAEKFNHLLNEVSGDARLSLIQVSQLNPATAILLQRRIDQGELVVIMGDRVPLSGAGRTSHVPFLGSPAPFPQGPFILASLLKCPVLSLFCVRNGDRFEMTFNRLAEQITLSRGRRDQELERMVQRFVEDLERHCMKAPLQWFNFYDFWHQDYP